MPSSAELHKTLDAHVDRVATATPSYTSPFSAFKRSSRDKSKPRTKHAFPVADSERSAARAAAPARTNQFYDMVTHSYERGWSKHFHFAPFAPGDSISHALNHIIYRLAVLLQLQPNMKILDVGCGIGAASRELAKLVGCEVIGVTINQYQVNRAIELTAREGLGHLCTFIQADFMDLPFPDNYFDAVIAFEALCHAPSAAHVYAQCNRVLKPGKQLGFTDELMTDAAGGGAYDETNAKHRDVRNHLEVGGGIASMQTTSAARQALNRAGFKIELDENYIKHFEKLSGPVPFVLEDDHTSTSTGTSTDTSTSTASNPNTPTWNGKRIISFSPVKIPHRSGATHYHAPPPQPPYPPIVSTAAHPIPPPFRPVSYPLMGTKAAIAMTITAEDRKTVADMRHSNRRLMFTLTKIFAWLKLCPRELVHLNKMMALYVDGVVEGVEMEIFSPNWMFVCTKLEGKCEEGLLEPFKGAGAE